MIKLIFNIEFGGHYLEYLHHLYCGAINDVENTYYIVVPKNKFQKVQDKLDWPSSSNVFFRYLTDEELNFVRKGRFFRIITESILIRKIAKEVKASEILLIYLSPLIPILPFILPNHIKIRGVIYLIYIRCKQGLVRNLFEKLRYSVLAHNRSIKKVFMLNDPMSAERLNKIYKTNHFAPIPDPLPYIDESILKNIKVELGIKPDCRLFVHAGSMTERKGTLELIKSLQMLPEDFNGMFVFAGKVHDSIKSEFFFNLNIANRKGVRVLVFDEFCDYQFLNNLFYSSDCILIPYKRTDQSSGLVGYASYFMKPVIGPASGLIGDLIRTNGLGYCINHITPESIVEAIVSFQPMKVRRDYAERNTITEFCNIFLNDEM